MKGIILAGGTGSRLWPVTQVVSKQLMPIYNKPMIYYPLATLMMAEIRELLVITTPEHRGQFAELLGDGSRLGMRIEFAEQPEPAGLAQVFLIGERFIGTDGVALALGDNIFHGTGLGTDLRRHTGIDGAVVFAHHVTNPQDYGVVEFDDRMRAISIEEKPESPRSNYAIPGLYFYDNDVVRIARSIRPSPRGELEISSINEAYLTAGRLRVQTLERGTVWLDAGTLSSMLEAAEYVRVIEERQGFMIGCIQEIAWRNGWIDDDRLLALSAELNKSGYARYLRSLLV